MQLRRLEIIALPGIEPGFSIDRFGPGINVVHGHNAIGKSSLGRALRHLLYPNPQRDQGIRLKAEFASGPGILTVENIGGDVKWRIDGEPVTAPVLPEEAHLGCYVLSLEELLAAGHSEAEFAATVSRELTGGYDLGAAARDANFLRRPQHGRSEQRTLGEASRALRIVQDEHTRLDREQRRLAQIDQEMVSAQRASREHAALTAAIVYAERSREYRECELALARLPPELAKLRGDELQRLNQLDEQITDCQLELNAAEAIRSRAWTELAKATGLATLERSQIDEQSTILDALRSNESARELLSKRRNQALGRREVALVNLQGDDGDGLDQTYHVQSQFPLRSNPQILSEVEQKLSEKRRLELEVARVRPQDPPDGAEDVADQNQLRDARAALYDWLRVPESSGHRGRPSAALAVIVLAFITAVVVAAWQVHLAFGLLAIVALATVPMFRAGRADTEGLRLTAVERYTRTNVEPPPTWSVSAVNTHLPVLDDALAQAKERELRRTRQNELRIEFESTSKALQEVTESLSEVAHRVGFDPLKLDLGFERWMGMVKAHDDASAELNEIRREEAQLESEADRLAERLTAFIAKFLGAEPPGEEHTGARQIGARLQDLTRRLERHQKISAELKEIELSCARHAQGIEQAQRASATIYAQAGIGSGHREQLASLLDRLPQFQTAVDSVKRAQGAAEEAGRNNDQSPSAERPQVSRAIAELDIQSMRTLQTECVSEAARESELTATRAQIETRLDQARTGRRLEEARAARDKARLALEDRMQEALYSAAGRQLLALVESEYRAENEPVLLKEADRWFRTFTHHHYELRMSADSRRDQSGTEVSTLRALDTRQGVVQSLSELSTNTRISLLLAARLAFTRQLEAGRESLPLFLDETLGTADPARYRAVVQTLNSIARCEQRQLFYMTAQPQELTFWGAADTINRIDLGQLRERGQATDRSFELPADFPPEPLRLQGQSTEEVATKLSVSAFSGFEPAARVHLFHLLRDRLDLLEVLVTHRVQGLGTARSILSSSAGAALLTRQQRHDLAWRLDAAETWLEAWTEGRGRPLHAVDIKACPELTKVFSERFAALMDALCNNASTLLTLIDERAHDAVKGFRADRRTSFEAWLLDEGFLDPRPVLDDDARYHRVLARLHRQIGLGDCQPTQIQACLGALGTGIRERH